MIARQRHNLGLTFYAAEQTEVPTTTQQRILTNERELLDATRELADGMAAQGGPIQPLEDACAAMAQAENQLQSGAFVPAVDSQQQALAALIRARKNIRQRLSPANSSSATACRQFDRQQRQKLRTPEELKKQKQQELAESRQQLNQLAQRQREWSDEVKSGSSSVEREPTSPPQSQEKSETSSASSQSSEQLKQSQAKMADEMRQLQQKLAQLDTGSQQAPEQAEQIADEMQASLDALEKQNEQQAADRARQSADRLERLADHLAALNSTDFAQRLGHAQQMAQQLGQSQTALQQQLPGGGQGEAKPSAEKAGSQSDQSGNATRQGSAESAAKLEDLAQRQDALASEAELLAELMSRLRADSPLQAPEVQPSLTELEASNSPAEIAQQMSEAAADLSSGKAEQAGKTAGAAAQRLEDLAKALQELRGEFGQPSLDELIALEKQMASLIEQVGHSNTGSAQAAAEARFNELEPKLEAVAAEDARVGQALAQLRSGGSGNAAADRTQPVAPGFYTRSRWADRTALQQLNKALQVKIQEAILAGALLDADDSVPPEYKELVETYYRELSDDLR